MSLTGKRILLTQAKGQAGQLINMLNDLGAEIVHKPMIAIQPPDDVSELDRNILSSNKIDWIIFTSKNSVEAFGKRISALHINMDFFTNLRFAVIGDSTADTLKKFGFDVGFKPDVQTSEGFLDDIDASHIELDGAKILFPAGNIARDTVPDGLRERGAEVVRVTAYTTVPVDYSQEEIVDIFKKSKKIDIAIFTSSSTVDNLFRLLLREKLDNCVHEINFVSIGPATTKTLRQYGIEPAVETETQSMQGLVGALKKYYN